MIEDKDGCPKFNVNEFITNSQLISLKETINSVNKSLYEWFQKSTVVWSRDVGPYVWSDIKPKDAYVSARIVGERKVVKDTAENVLRDILIFIEKEHQKSFGYDEINILTNRAKCVLGDER